MAKLRLLGWVALVGAAGWWSLTGLTWSADPAEQVMTVVRAVAGVLAAYLFVATVLAIRMPRVAPAFVRRLVAGAVGTALLVAPMTASASTADDRPAVEAPVLRRIEDPPPPAFSAPPLPHVDGTEAENATTVTVAAGEHLWSIAERALASRLGRAPSDAEIAVFWTEVIAANEGRLASGDPDLVFPGESVVLPS